MVNFFSVIPICLQTKNLDRATSNTKSIQPNYSSFKNISHLKVQSDIKQKIKLRNKRFRVAFSCNRSERVSLGHYFYCCVLAQADTYREAASDTPLKRAARTHTMQAHAHYRQRLDRAFRFVTLYYPVYMYVLCTFLVCGADYSYLLLCGFTFFNLVPCSLASCNFRGVLQKAMLDSLCPWYKLKRVSFWTLAQNIFFEQIALPSV